MKLLRMDPSVVDALWVDRIVPPWIWLSTPSWCTVSKLSVPWIALLHYWMYIRPRLPAVSRIKLHNSEFHATKMHCITAVSNCTALRLWHTVLYCIVIMPQCTAWPLYCTVLYCHCGPLHPHSHIWAQLECSCCFAPSWLPHSLPLPLWHWTMKTTQTAHMEYYL